MDAERFDALAKALATRRRVLGLVAGAVGGLTARGQAGSAAIHLYCGVACAQTINNCAFPDDGCGTCCNDVCVDPTKDPTNCGACGNACPNGADCVNATCQLTCAAGQTLCGDACVDLSSDPHNCLACGVACGANGACCGNGCLDITSDPANCGGCGVACQAGQACCAGACWDLSNDVTHCGNCDTVCPAGQVCQDGGCAGGCANGLTWCGGNCVDLGGDAANCGACGNACAAGQRCVIGGCATPPPGPTPTPQCPDGRQLCSGACVDLSSDMSNCGDCGAVCTLDLCDQGRCGCGQGSEACNGACVDTQTDPKNCGGCGNACAGSKSCCGGACADLQNDSKNCGKCGVVCPPGWTCDKGVCSFHRSGGGSVVTRRRYSPEFCTVKPRPLASLRKMLQSAVNPALYITPGPITPTPPPPTPTPMASPVSGNSAPNWQAVRAGVKIAPKLANDALRAAVENAAAEVSACGNANDPARVTALMTDDLAAAWLQEHNFTSDKLNHALATPALALPEASWEEIADVSRVLDLGHGYASAVVTYPAPVDGEPPWHELQVFKVVENNVLLDRKVVMKLPNDPGTIVLRGWDCLLNMTRETFASDLCTPSVFDEPWSLTLTSADGKTIHYLAWPDASFPEEGVATWEKLPPGDWTLELIGMSKIGPPVVVFGAEVDNDDPYKFRIVLSGRNPYNVVDVYKLPNVASAPMSELARRLALAYRCPKCPPCHVCDIGRAMCVYTCPQCSKCGTYLTQNGETISYCQDGCTANQGICRHNRCCRGLGTSCAADADCCNGVCFNGTCSCVRPDSACSEDADCCQTDAFTTIRCADTVICHAVKPLGSTCSSDLDCYPGQCFGGKCHCCATPCEVGAVNSAGLCCEYPKVPLCQPDSSLGKGFVRCCTPGIDCVGDPNGPPAAPTGTTPTYNQGTPTICA